MTALMRVWCAVSLAVVLTAAGPQVPPRDRSTATPTGTSSIVGRVVVAPVAGSPATPLRRARVRLDGDGMPTKFTDTDTEGGFRFDRLPGGQYSIVADKPGFIGRSTPFVLAERQAVRVDLAVSRAGAIEGRLTTDAGEAAYDVTVSAVRFVHSLKGRRPVTVRQAVTDDLGRFRIHTLPAGEYYVEALAQSSIVVRDGIRSVVAPPVAVRQGLARTYYPGTSRVNDAQRIRVGIGAEVSGLDFAMARVPVARVAGLATDSAGTRNSSFRFRLQSAGGDTVLGDRASAVFEFATIPPGDYWLTGTAIPTGGRNRTANAQPATIHEPEFFAMRLTVAGQDLTDLIIRTERGARLEGLVETDTRTVAPSLSGLHVIAHEVEFELPGPPASATPVSAAVTGADGRFVIRSLFGPRIIRIEGLPSGWAVKRLALDDRDITDTPIDFRAAPGPRTLRVLITDRTATVTGMLTAADPTRPLDAQIVVFADDERLWRPPSRFVKSVRSTAGRFSIDGLLPGTYLVCAAAGLEEDSWTDPDVLRQLKPLATIVLLAEGEERGVMLTPRSLP
ncbi:MAG: carboxypeptidase regulatory-like domain-containing protein [Acidobacteria bacterium]|nr:carboxypeptidase regulatory-like domain-containing protein [Acidobacteriota bacterium]